MTARILFLDDDEEMQALLIGLMSRAPYDACFVSSGVRALIEIFRAYEDKQPFDALILDCALPHFDGFTIAMIVRMAESTGIARRAKIGFLTAFAKTVEQSTLLEKVGADAYWRKPEDVVELPQLLAELLSE